MLFNHLILSHFLLLPSIFLSIRVFTNESVLCIRWPKYWSFSFSIRRSNEYSVLPFGLTSWISLLSKGLPRFFFNSTVQKHQFFGTSFLYSQLSHPYMTTRKSIALTRQTFVSKIIPLLFNMLSKLVIAFLPRSKRLLISWLQSPSAVIFLPVTVSSASPSICHEVTGLDAMTFVF